MVGAMEEIKQKIYRRKIIDEILKYLYDRESIILYGARQVGKTFILYWLLKFLKEENEDVYYLDLEDRRYLHLLNQGPDALKELLIEQGFDIGKKVFVLIDEIQYLDNPTTFLKLVSDHYHNFKIIASGSSTLELKKKVDKALVGRALVFEVYGLTFDEFLTFKEYPGPKMPVLTHIKQEELLKLFTEFVLYGGYPRCCLIPEKTKKEKYLWQIINTYLKKDIRDLAEVKEIDKFNKLLEILASQSGKLLNIEELSNTCRLAKQTVERYLFVLENTYVLRLVRPFSKNLRSEIFKTPKIYFYDSGLAHLLWLKVFSPEILGEIFETAIFSELVKNFGKEFINYWRTKDKKEIDFILRYKNRIIPIEAKVNFAAFSKRKLDYFMKKYKTEQWYLIGLKGERPQKKHSLFPWEINTIKI